VRLKKTSLIFIWTRSKEYVSSKRIVKAFKNYIKPLQNSYDRMERIKQEFENFNWEKKKENSKEAH